MLIIFIIPLLILTIQCISISMPSGTSTSGSINKSYASTGSCGCNLVDSVCEDYCCCDVSDCADQSDVLIGWELQRKCSNKHYASTYTIPDCDQNSQKEVQDLYQGLRIAYNIFKNMACVMNPDKNQDKFYNSQVAADPTDIQEYVDKIFPIIITPTNTIDQAQFIKVNGVTMTLQLPSQYSETCQSTSIAFNKQYSPLKCLRKIVKSQLVLSDFDWTTYSNPMVVNGVSMTVTPTLRKVSLINNEYILTSDTFPLTIAATNSGQYFVYGVIYSLGYTNQALVNIKASIMVLEQIVLSDIMYIPQIMGVYYTQVQNIDTPILPIYQSTGNAGYSVGSYIRFKDTYGEVLQPMYLGLSNSLGTCFTPTIGQTQMYSNIKIQFLHNQEIVCQKLIDVNTLYFLTQFETIKSVAVYGDSNPNEWIDVTTTSCDTASTTTQFPSLDFTYTPYGEKGKERYKINKFQITCQQDKQARSATFKLYSLFIRFIEVTNDYIHYKAPPPQIINGLDDDVLAPFISYS